MMRYAKWLSDYFQISEYQIFCKYEHFSWDQLECFLHDLFVFCFLILAHIKASFLSHANIQNSEVVAYLPVDYTTNRMSMYTDRSCCVKSSKKALYGWMRICARSEEFSCSQKGWSPSNCILTFRQIHAGFKVCA